MLRWLAVFAFTLLSACTADRCRVYGTWMADGGFNAAPFIYPHAAFLRRDAAMLTGYRASVPTAYRSGVMFPSEFEQLNGLGTNTPLLVSDDFVEFFFRSPAGLKIGLYRAADLQAVPLDPLPNPPRLLRGALPHGPLDPGEDYYMVVSGRPSSLPCNDGSIVALTEDDAEAERIASRLRPALPRSRRSIVVPFRTQTVDEVLQAAARHADGHDAARIVSARAYAALDAEGRPNAEVFGAMPKLIRGIRYGEKPKMPLDSVATVVRGEVDTVEYRTGGRLDETAIADHGHRRIEFLLTLPPLDAQGRLPRPGAPGRAPLIIFSHPLRACKEAALGLADTLAQYGFAVAAIDHVEHGSRQSDPPDDYVCGESIPWEFFAAGNPAALRDNVRASALDLYQFKLALQRAPAELFDVNADGVKDIETDRVGLVAMSLGSIIAVPFLALAGDVEAAVLNTALGSTIELLDQHNEGTSKYALPFPGPMPSLNLALAQAILDGGEPINFAAALRAHPRDLLVQEAVDDSVVPNSSTAKLARELDLTLIEPVHSAIEGLRSAPTPYAGKPTRALYQVPNVNHSFLLIPRNEKILEPARRQVGYFLYTHWVQGHGTVVPIAP